MKAEIVPAVLARNSLELEAGLKRIINLSPAIHLDVADGEFVDLLTPPPKDFPVIHESKDLFWHLMVNNPEEYLNQITRASIIAVHAEAEPKSTIVNDIKNKGALACLVLNPETTVEAVLDLALNFDVIQIMTVQPGAQGRNFLFDQLPKINEIRGLLPAKQVVIDGGVSRATIEVASKYHPDTYVVGSAIMAAEDPADEYQVLERLALLS